MGQLADISYDSIVTYFNTLAALGYKSYKSVDRLLVLYFIEELLDGTYKDFITEEDYKSITNALYCLFGVDCLLPFPEYISNTLSYNNFIGMMKDNLEVV
jgi:hypothetical protein|nr:MAG TPA: hypothetical protein [Bacteriophage sp.]